MELPFAQPIKRLATTWVNLSNQLGCSVGQVCNVYQGWILNEVNGCNSISAHQAVCMDGYCFIAH